MNALEDRIRNPMFNNWVKSALTLDFARDAVKEFVEKEININHKSLVRKISAACSLCNFNTCTNCPNKTTCNNEKLKQEIQKSHNNRKPSFDNTNPKDCWSQPWEFAKCFMPQYGYGNITVTDGTDFPSLIHVIVNNVDLRKKISNDDKQFKKAKEDRNEIMHNPRFNVDDQTFKGYTEDIRNMLFCIEMTDTVKSALSRIDELSSGTLTITATDIARVINEAIASLKLLSDEIIDSIPEMSKLSQRCTQEIENRANECVEILQIIVTDGVFTIQHKTKEGVKEVHDETEHGLENIKKETTEATDQLSVKKKEVVDAIASKSNEEASQFQNLSEERTVALQKAAEKESEALKQKGYLVTEELKKEAKKESIALKEKLERIVKYGIHKLENDIKKITKKEIETEDVKDEISQNAAEIQRTSDACVTMLKKVTTACLESFYKETEIFGDECVTTLQKVTADCSESLYKETELFRTFIKSQSEHDTHNDIENKLMELSGTMQELKSRQRKVCPFDNLDIELKSEEICSITCVAKVSADKLAVVDKVNSRVKVINVRSNTIMSYIEVDNPSDIICVNQSLLVVSCNNTLQFLELKNDVLTVGMKCLEFPDWCEGFDYTDVEKLFAVSFGESQTIRMINMEGDTVREIKLQQVVQGLSKQVYLKFSRDGSRIYVVNSMLHKCMCFNSLDGSLLHTYEHAKLESPNGIAVDKAGNVYIAGVQSNNIHLVSPDGLHVSILLDKSNGIDQPRAIAYCDQEHTLYVSHCFYGKDVVSICPV